MQLITTITNNARQSFSVPINDGIIEFKLYYYITQKSWFFDFSFNDYTCKGNRITITPNAIRHLRKILPFGIMFMSDGHIEPFSLNDFANQRVQMYILNRDEVEEIESEIYG